MGSTLVKLMPGVSPEAMTLCGLCNGTGATTKRQMMITEGNLWFEAGVILPTTVLFQEVYVCVCVTLVLCDSVRWQQQLKVSSETVSY